MKTMIRSAAAAALAALVLAAPAAAQTTLVSGTLRDAAGNPSAGAVRVYAWPHHTTAMTLPLMGEATAGLDGSFTVAANDEAQLAELARQRDGWLDFIAIGETPGYRGEWTFTSMIGGTAERVRSVTPAAVSPGTARAAAAGRPPNITITSNRRNKPIARAAQAQQCKNVVQVQEPKSEIRWAIVGELNNAYNDGTRSRFSYGAEGHAETNVGVAVSTPVGKAGDVGFSIGGETHIATASTQHFPWVDRRYARKLRTKFEFTREAARVNTCAAWDVRIRATSWLTGNNDSLKQAGALDKCDTSHVGHHTGGPGSRFIRNNNHAVRWNKGAEAFGVFLTTQSGFSRNVKVEYKWGGSRSKLHYICGSDGKESPETAGRIFSGSKK